MNALFHTRLDFSSVTVESIQQLLARIKQLYTETYDQVAALLSSAEKINFSTAVQPLINLAIYIQKAQTLCNFPMNIHTDETVREASTNAATEMEKLVIECGQREDVFQVLHQYEVGAYQDEKSQLHPEHNRYFEHAMRDYKRNGLYISDSATKARVRDIKQKISALSIQFEHNIGEDNTSFIMSASELAGLPSDWFTKEREVSPGRYKVTLKYPDLFPILDHAKDRDTRKKIFTAYESRCEAENLPILKTILELKNELAQLLGYKTHAAYVAEIRMVGNSQIVETFLNDMNQRFTPLLEKNLKDLTDFARAKEHDDTLQLEISDMRYYMRLREEAMCTINMEEIKDYFPQEKVINGTLSIYEKLLGLKFIERANSNAWHPDVKYYDAYNCDTVSGALGEKIGGFYLDLHPRDGKYSHAEAVVLQAGCDISHLSGISANREPCISAMVCNFPKNENLPFDDVVTFFHEFGHVMHFTCCKTQLLDHRAETTETDFVEAPSQMLENWCYEPDILRILSAHSQTQEPLPQAIAMQLKNQDKIHAGYVNKRQLNYGCFDFNVHNMSGEELRNLDLKHYGNQLRADILQLPTAEGCFPASFDHLVGGYDAGYYGYLLSKTYATDMFASVFQQDPLSTANGMRYRQCILEPGASKDGMEMIVNFLGRKPEITAFLRYYGLSDVTVNRKRSRTGLFDNATTEDTESKKFHRDERESAAPSFR